MAPSTRLKGHDQGQRNRGRQVSSAWVRGAAEDFERTGNPVFAWDAIATCLAARIAFPPTIREYLLTVARDIAQLSRTRIPGKGHVDRATAAALKLSGRGRSNPFRAMSERSHGLMVAFDVYTYHTQNWWRHRQGLEPTHDWGTVFREVAASHRCEGCPPSGKRISAPTVRRYWYKHALQIIPRHLIEASQSQKLDDILR